MSSFRDASGKFPEYPDEDEGGSAAIFKEKDPAEIEAELTAKVPIIAILTGLYTIYDLAKLNRHQ